IKAPIGMRTRTPGGEIPELLPAPGTPAGIMMQPNLEGTSEAAPTLIHEALHALYGNKYGWKPPGEGYAPPYHYAMKIMQFLNSKFGPAAAPDVEGGILGVQNVRRWAGNATHAALEGLTQNIMRRLPPPPP